MCQDNVGGAGGAQGGTETDSMERSGAKQQVLGLTKEVRTAWQQVGDNATTVAKYLGVSHSG